ncbi:MAG: MarC family protein [Oscillatoriales cyanobacterium RM2_1_1]|nr:MarC family protein [Oscillatoriales cyanobacterium SM2_3_0]NJO47118.1 MarC family protein [Oscillatoriales cyanobacterium RM2_1_1]
MNQTWYLIGKLGVALLIGWWAQTQSAVAQTADLNYEPVADYDLDVGLFNLFIIFFVTLGPLKIIPAFIYLTEHADRKLRRQLAFRSAAISTIVILLVAIIGQNTLRVWRINLSALAIAGGILLFVVALNIVMTQYTPAIEGGSPEKPALHLAIVPLAFPTILPPFGIAIALTLVVLSHQIEIDYIAVLGLLVLVMGLNLVSMLAARAIVKVLKLVILRILGFTLGVMQLALGIQFILFGIEIEVLFINHLLNR